MLDPSSFDKAVKAAEKLNKLLEKSNALSRLKGIDATVAQLKSASDQVGRILRRNQMLKDVVTDLAMKQARINQTTLERVRFYDNELAVIKRNSRALQQQIDIKKSDCRLQAAQFQQDIANIQRKVETKRQLETRLQSQLAKMNDADPRAAKLAEQIAKTQKQTVSLETQLNNTQQRSIELRNKSLLQLKAIESDLQDQLDLEKALNEQKNIDQKSIFKAQRIDQAKTFIKDNFGAGIAGQLARLAKSIAGLGVALGILGIFALLLKSVVNAYRDGLKATIDAGLAASQRSDEVIKAQNVVAESRKSNVLISIEDAVKAKMALTNTLGTLDIPETLIVKSATLTRQLGISSEEASSLLDIFTRIRGESATAASLSATIVQATATRNKMNPSVVMRDVAANAENFAKAGRASAEELAKAAIITRRMGVDLNTVANIADRMVTDFEGTLEAQANIGAFAPGFDQTGLMMASQFGTDADIARELKAAVDSLGTDFDNLPRSFKLSIANGLGLSVDQLAKISKSGIDQLDTVSPDTKALIDANSGALNEVQKAIVNPLDSLNTVVTSGFAWLMKRFGFGGSDDVSGQAESRAVGGTAGIDSSPYMSLMSVFKRLNSNEIPTILHRGEAVLNKAQMNMLGQVTNIRSNLTKSVTGLIGNFSNKFASEKGVFGKVSGLLSGNLKGQALNMMGKIPGIGGIANGLLSGGGLKNIGGNLLKVGADKAIGAVIGSVIPGAGTLVGSLMGGFVGKGLGKLTNSKVGKAVTGFISSKLFGKKKKTSPLIQADYSQQAGLSGILNYAGNVLPSLYNSGINMPAQYTGGVTAQNQNTSSTLGNTQALEAKFDTLINLLKTGAIAINLDGKKVSDSLVDANRYG